MTTEALKIDDADDLHISPMSLFRDVTMVDESWKRKIERHCVRLGYFPFIDYSPEHNEYLFHTILTPDGGKREKQFASMFRGGDGQRHEERRLEHEVFKSLKDEGVHPKRQVRCASGIIDIVTDTHIIEIKAQLSLSDAFKAIGQVLMYRQAHNKRLTPRIICGRRNVSDSVVECANHCGVEIQVWSKS